MRFLLLILVITPSFACAQINIDFESGNTDGWDFSSPGRWGIDNDNSLSGLFSLKHIFDNPDSGTDMATFRIIGLHPELGDAAWEFTLKYESAPSSANNWAYFLVSDVNSELLYPGGKVNGFALGVNIDGSDDTLSLWKFKEGNPSLVLKTSVNWQIDIGVDSVVTLKTMRSISGEWSISIVDSWGVSNQVGNGSDNELFSVNYSGLYYKYTSSRDRLLWLDDITINGQFIPDTDPPEAVGSDFISSTRLRVRFNEAVYGKWNDPLNYTLLPGYFNPDYVSRGSENSLILVFNNPLSNKQDYELIIDTVSDISGNYSLNLSITSLLAIPEWGDIVISEFMSDPDPPIDIPFEYIEIYNTSEYSFNTESLLLINGTALAPLPGIILSPSDYLILCDDSNLQYYTGNQIIVGVQGFPTLNNLEDEVLLADTLSGTIHGVDYNSDWFRNTLKSEGGWALEMKDLSYPFSGSLNWKLSESSTGGTPGEINSVAFLNPDIIQPMVVSLYPPSDSVLWISFSEPVSDISKIVDLITFDGLDIKRIVKTDSLRRKYSIFFSDHLVPGRSYTTSASGITDYANNILLDSYPMFGLVSEVEENDLVINEILFDALDQGEEFIELFNRSEKIINLAEITGFCINTQSGDTGTHFRFSEDPNCFMPGSYYVITEDKPALGNRYFSSNMERIFELVSIPSLPNQEGRIIIMSKDLRPVDNVSYNEDYHHDLIGGTRGVSLERIDAEGPSNQRYNWHSASGIDGWATPGRKNSVSFNDEGQIDLSVSLSSKRVSPDGDGYEDVLKISLSTGSETCIINSIIYDDMGYPVNRIVTNLTASGNSSFFWDGSDGNGNPLPEGIYIIFISSVSDSGKVKKWKKVCALVRF